MRHRARILSELMCLQERDIFNPLHTARIHIGRELRIPEYREAFLKTELKPVAAGHAIAGIIVKILVSDYRLNALITQISGDIRVRQYAGGIEDIQTLVLHRPHVEVINRDDVKEV